MSTSPRNCPDCEDGFTPVSAPTSTRLSEVSRRQFMKTGAVAAGAIASGGLLLPGAAGFAEEAAQANKDDKPQAETVVKHLFESLTPQQKETVCFGWDHTENDRGLLRTRVENNWNITEPSVDGDYFTKDQQQMIRDIYEGIIHPSWHAKIDKQLEDDAGGFGIDQSIAIFGQPGSEKFEFVMTGRHMTIRCDGNTSDHLAFGGPVFYGHAASDFNESKDHPGNVFWEQAVAANRVYAMLDGKQRKQAEVARTPREGDAAFQGKQGERDGIRVEELSADQREEVQKVLQKLIEPYRQSDRDEIVECLKTQGGIDACKLAFYTDNDIGDDKVWDNWRLEGPSFVWHFRGAPHVHCWVNVADSSDVKTNTPFTERGARQRG